MVKTADRWTWWVVGALVLAALGLRVWSLNFGLPGVYNMDERPILDRALAFAKGSLNPKNFLYPTLYLYLLFAWEALYFVVGWAAGWFGSLAAFQAAFFTDPSGHVLAGRLLTALFGAATVVAVYLFGERLYGKAVGLGAAALMAVTPLAVRDAHYIKLDVPVTFFAALACAGLAVIVSDGAHAARRRRWVVAGIFAGLAISTQYYAAFLAFPFLSAAVADLPRSGRWKTSAGLLLWGGAGTVLAFAITSPFFVLEPGVIVRDFTELRQVDIDRAVGFGPFSSLGPYTSILVHGGFGPLACAAALLGAVLALAEDWRKGLLLVSFPLAFLAFVANTFPASRYLNIVLPSLAVAAAFGAWQVARAAGRRQPAAMIALTALLAAGGAYESLKWNRFFGQPDTRTLASAFIEREVPDGATVLVQPYSAPLRQSHAGLLEAVRARLGSEAKAPVKVRLQLAATPAPPSYRVLWVGEGGKTGAPPMDIDKVYISPRAFESGNGLTPLRQARVDYVVLTRYGPTASALVPLETALQREAHKAASFSPYRAGIDPRSAPVPPFRHNGNTWIDPSLERPGPVVDIWRVGR